VERQRLEEQQRSCHHVEDKEPPLLEMPQPKGLATNDFGECPRADSGRGFTWYCAFASHNCGTDGSSQYTKKFTTMSTMIRHASLNCNTRQTNLRMHRPWQQTVLTAWEEGKNCLVVSGTGSGKSVCFQAPALLAGGKVVVVVSPLISLMRDQVTQLHDMGISSTWVAPQSHVRV
jgi:hypothetical protein